MKFEAIRVDSVCEGIESSHIVFAQSVYQEGGDMKRKANRVRILKAQFDMLYIQITNATCYLY